jgi:hypothetical protein
MTDPVKIAIEEIRATYPDATVTVQGDNDGGAHVIVEPVSIGEVYIQDTSWIGFRITFQYPYADVYPHFVRSDLQRRDGRPLGDGISGGHTFIGRSAVQLSRRSNNLNPGVDTAVLKLGKVLRWLATHP